MLILNDFTALSDDAIAVITIHVPELIWNLSRWLIRNSLASVKNGTENWLKRKESVDRPKLNSNKPSNSNRRQLNNSNR